MLQLRPYSKLGGGDHGWLTTRNHFSFADYHDPQRMHWGQLRVLNDDTIAPHTGFSAHPHKDMEIITYVREGAISHRDSMGHAGRTEAGRGLAPRWSTKQFPGGGNNDGLTLLASGRKALPQTLHLNADAELYGATANPGVTLKHEADPARGLYLVLARGHVSVNGTAVGPGDGLAIKDTTLLQIEFLKQSDMLLIDAAP